METPPLNSVRAALEGPVATPVGGEQFATYLLDDDDLNILTAPIPTTDGRTLRYVLYGPDNLFPYHLQDLIHATSVTARCQLFNIQTCYGQGLQFKPAPCPQEPPSAATTQPLAPAREEAARQMRRFLLRNDVPRLFMEQVTDMKYFDFAVLIVVLTRDRQRIARVMHRDACHVRLTPRDAQGRSPEIIVANFRHAAPAQAEAFQLLDPADPLGDLLVRSGREPDPATGLPRTQAQVEAEPLAYAVISRMPTVGYAYYPLPYYTAIFNDYWYDIYRLIGIGKRHLIQNTSSPRLQIEVHKSYWDNVCDEENITDEAARLQRKLQERRDITDFCTKPENAGKAWVTSYDTTLDGHAVSMVNVRNLAQGSSKEGGDWSDDMQEAANNICFAMGVHPNVAGATPGKAQMNNSGSDKRELFTLKQSLERLTHDLLLQPWHLILHYNGLDPFFTPTVPMLELATLDTGASAIETPQAGEA